MPHPHGEGEALLLALANELGGLYPAAESATELEAFAGGVDYYGGQQIYDVLAEASVNVNPDFTWGPTMTQTYTDVSDGFGTAIGGSGTPWMPSRTDSRRPSTP